MNIDLEKIQKVMREWQVQAITGREQALRLDGAIDAMNLLLKGAFNISEPDKVEDNQEIETPQE